MTRKKFIKTLMAIGCQRNDAVLYAQLVVGTGKSYECAWTAVYTDAMKKLKLLYEAAAKIEERGSRDGD